MTQHLFAPISLRPARGAMALLFACAVFLAAPACAENVDKLHGAWILDVDASAVLRGGTTPEETLKTMRVESDKYVTHFDLTQKTVSTIVAGELMHTEPIQSVSEEGDMLTVTTANEKVVFKFLEPGKAEIIGQTVIVKKLPQSETPPSTGEKPL